MKKRDFKITVLLITALCVALVSCPLLWPDMSKDDMWIRGRTISSYPGWLRHKIFEIFSDPPAYGVSEWTDWQSEQARQFYDLVPDTVIGNDFSGKFRLVLLGQNTSIVFNDVNHTSYALFFNWVHKMNSTTLTMDIPQEDEEHKYEYDCHIKTNLREPETSDNKGKVIFTRLSSASDQINKFNYKLICQGKTIIDFDLYNSFDVGTADIEPYNLSWFPRDVGNFSKKHELVDGDYKYYDQVEIGTLMHFSMQLDTDNMRKGGLFSFEGISLKEVDDSNKTISFWLEDRDKGGFADYVTIKVHDDLKYADIAYYKQGETEPIRTDSDIECFYE